MDQPNILFLLNDHQSYHGQGMAGMAQPARPHFDRLAAGGINFSRAYTTCALCTPARRSMLTGLLPHNHGYLCLDKHSWHPSGPQELLFSRLQSAGYDCSYFGKWHAGLKTALDYGCTGFSLPGYGNPYTSEQYQAYLRQNDLPPITVETAVALCEGTHRDHARVGTGLMCHCGGLTWHVAGRLETPDETHEAFFLASLAKRQLQEHARSRRPFFMSVHFWGPHVPFMAGRRFAEMYPPESFPEYPSFREELGSKCRPYRFETNRPLANDRHELISPPAMPWGEWQKIYQCDWGQITMVDEAGGQILDELERLGLADNTLVIWTSDHGHPAGAHGGHFDKNAFLCQENLRIPLAMRWPGRVPAGVVEESLVSNMDIPVAMAAAVGNPFARPLDGDNLLRLCCDEHGRAPWRSSLLCETHGHHGEPVRGRCVVTGRYSFAAYDYADEDGIQIEAYDLSDDPFEMNDLTRDPANRGVVDDLHDELRRVQLESGDRLMTGAVQPRW